MHHHNNDTNGKFATGINDTGGKIAAAIKATLAANLPPVSKILKKWAAKPIEKILRFIFRAAENISQRLFLMEIVGLTLSAYKN